MYKRMIAVGCILVAALSGGSRAQELGSGTSGKFYTRYTCGAGYITVFQVNEQSESVNQTNYMIKLDNSNGQPDDNVTFYNIPDGDGTDYILVNWDDVSRFAASLQTAQAAYLAGSPVIVQTNNSTNTCVTNSNAIIIRTCADPSDSRCTNSDSADDQRKRQRAAN